MMMMMMTHYFPTAVPDAEIIIVVIIVIVITLQDALGRPTGSFGVGGGSGGGDRDKAPLLPSNNRGQCGGERRSRSRRRERPPGQ